MTRGAPVTLMLMNRRAAVVVVAAPLLVFAQPNRKEREANKLEVTQMRCARDQGKITLDGEVRNVGARRLAKLVLVFSLLDADRKTISRRRGAADEAWLDPGETSAFHFYIPDHARAVEILIEAEQRGMEMDVAKPGPYPID
jgi:hypothetical protein